jgi:hypothetical protein
MKRTIAVVLAVAGLAGCGTPMHAEMLGESIKMFGGKTMKTGNETLWITGPNDSSCDSGCQLPAGCSGGKSGGSLGGLGGGLFGGGSKTGESSYDKLAYEVFANYFTQKKKMRVIESHRHNYSTQLNVQTHKTIETVDDKNAKVTTMSCEDLCLLDEAKKRKADKVLVYHIMEMSNDEMKIHFRLSDVQTGVVESAQTIKVAGMRARDASPRGLGAGGGEGGGGGGVD